MNRLLNSYQLVLMAICLSATNHLLHAQHAVRMDEAVTIAIANHPAARNAAWDEQNDHLLKQQAVELDPLHIGYWQRQTPANSDRLLTVMQNFGSIPQHIRKAQHVRTQVSVKQAERSLLLDELAWQVKAAYIHAVYCRQRLQTLQQYSPYFEALITAVETHLAADSIPKLTRVSAEVRYASFQSLAYIAEEQLKRAEMQLARQINLPVGEIEPAQIELDLYQIHPDKDANSRFEPVKHRAIDQAQQTETNATLKLEKSKRYPALHAGYIYRHIDGTGGYQGWMAGISLPLWSIPQRARITQAEIDVKIKTENIDYRRFEANLHIEKLKSLLNEYFVQIGLYRENLLLEADLLLGNIEKDFSDGRITNYADAFTQLNNVVSAKLNHLEYMNLYNQTALELEYYTQ